MNHLKATEFLMSSEVSPQRSAYLQENESIILPESLARSAGFVGLDAWMTFIHNVYGFPVYQDRFSK